MREWIVGLASVEALAFGVGGWVATRASVTLGFVAVASIEIPLLCAVQWRVLRRRLPALRWWHWTIATGAVAALTWAAAIAATAGSGATAAEEPPLVMQVGGYVVLGAAAGALMGVAQWWVLRRVAFVRGWVGWSVVAWAAGMPLSSMVTGSLPSGASAGDGLAYGLVGGGAMGAAVALLLWPAVRTLRLPEPSGRRKPSSRPTRRES